MSSKGYKIISNINIVPCQRYVCLCIEYLNFGKSEHFNKYKHCFITNENNLKYEDKGRNKLRKTNL
jgi:hypothetical protein